MPVADSRWGELILPAPDEAPAANPGGLRVVLFASYEFGYLAIEATKAYARRFPGRAQLVGLATDDPMNPDARISRKKRLWRLVGREEIVAIETAVVESALAIGCPVFTGEIKTDGFRVLLDNWRPDAIVGCMFGQIIDRAIIDRPPYGIYNFHPTDLAHGIGAGPTPAEDLAQRGLTSTVWTIHHVTEDVDAGGIVAVSPAINVADTSGSLPADSLVLYDKLLEPVGYLVAILIDALYHRFNRGETGQVDHLDVDADLPEPVKQQLAAPIRTNTHTTELPTFDARSLETF